MDMKDRLFAAKLGLYQAGECVNWWSAGWAGLRAQIASWITSAWAQAIEERGRWPLFAPVALGTGIGGYFALPFEPGWFHIVLILCPFCVGLLALAKPDVCRLDPASPIRHAGIVLCVFGCLIAAGFGSAKIRTELREGPVLSHLKSPVEFRGYITGAAKQEGGGWRLLIEPSDIQSIPSSDLPKIARVNVRQKGLSFEPGQTVRIWGQLMPPPDPVAPYAFDFARQSYFKQIGAVGFALGQPEILEISDGYRIKDRFSVWVSRWRLHLANRIRSHLPGETGAIAAALMTGDRDLISEDTRESMRVAGLAHLLAISGLHMALFGGLVFAASRFTLAAIEPLALRYNIKKASAVLGWVAALLYLVLTGASISTQRAFIMISLMFLAILIDRAALSMRSVTAAGFVILLIAPESLLDVGFQMSFSAVIALIAFYEAQRRRWLLNPNSYTDRSRTRATARKIGVYIVGIGLTTVVAEAATGPFAAFHFNRVAGYGLIGNLLVMPLVGVLIMPCAVLAFLLMPFDLEQFALAPMGWGIDWLLTVSSRISSWQGSEVYLRSWPTGALIAICLGGVWLAFWQTRWRFYGLVFVALGVLLAFTYDPPDVLIDRDGKNIAVKNHDDDLVVLSNRRAKFAAESWARQSGQSAPALANKTFVCDREGCLIRDPGLPKISYIMSATIAEEECQRADIVISRVPLPRRIRRLCRSHILVIDRFDLWRNGAHAIWFNKDGWEVRHTAGTRGDRPWSPAKR